MIELEPWGHARVVLMSIELWEGWTELRVAFIGEPGSDVSEPWPTGRWELGGPSGVIAVGLPSGGGGTDRMIVSRVELTAISDAAGPITLSVHHDDRVDVHELGDLAFRGRRQVSAATCAPPPDPMRGCPRCGTVDQRDGRRMCSPCAEVSRALGRAQDATQYEATPTGRPIMITVRTPDSRDIAFVAIEQWPGWFTIRYRSTADRGGKPPGELERWICEDDFGGSFEGMLTGESNWQAQIGFSGEVDPRASQLTVTRTFADETLLSADLPLLDPQPT